MEKLLGDHLPESKREQFLKDNCDKAEELGYFRKFSSEELRQKKDQLSTTSIEINDVELEKKEVMAGFKERLTPLTDERKALLGDLKLKGRHVREQCYKFIDQEASRVGYYNAQGELVEERAIYPEERQASIFHVQRTGSDN